MTTVRFVQDSEEAFLQEMNALRAGLRSANLTGEAARVGALIARGRNAGRKCKKTPPVWGRLIEAYDTAAGTAARAHASEWPYDHEADEEMRTAWGI